MTIRDCRFMSGCCSILSTASAGAPQPFSRYRKSAEPIPRERSRLRNVNASSSGGAESSSIRLAGIFCGSRLSGTTRSIISSRTCETVNAFTLFLVKSASVQFEFCYHPVDGFLYCCGGESRVGGYFVRLEFSADVHAANYPLGIAHAAEFHHYVESVA